MIEFIPKKIRKKINPCNNCIIKPACTQLCISKINFNKRMEKFENVINTLDYYICIICAWVIIIISIIFILITLIFGLIGEYHFIMKLIK